jgi:hypothetical protein
MSLTEKDIIIYSSILFSILTICAVVDIIFILKSIVKLKNIKLYAVTNQQML